MAKKEEKTNVMRLLERAQIEYQPHECDCSDGAIDGVSIARKIGISPESGFKTLVTRGADLASAAHLHRLLQALLGLPEPEWRHHPLRTDSAGKRLAKRDNAPPLRDLRARGISPADLRARLGFA